MRPTNWPSEHSDALRELLATGMSYSAIAKALNAKFGTSYTRNATLGRGKRMELGGPKKPEKTTRVPKAAKPCRPRRRRSRPIKTVLPSPPPKRAAPVRLRCVGIKPRLLPLVELAANDCRYPYGGDRNDDPITFCGHPRREGSSYCTAHFHLTRGPTITAERSAGPVWLRLVRAA